MSEPRTLQFPSYSQARFEKLKALLKQKGLTLSGNEGDAKRAGADVHFDEAASTLTLIVKHLPFWHNDMDKFCAQLTEVVNSVTAEP